jgi:superfamily II DNA or RNA helicase
MARPEAVIAIVEAGRLAQAHLINPAFATEISKIDPLPHQRIAVYDVILKQFPIRFLLADDAGAGKTIMAGLIIREMLTRQLIQRVLIIPPAGLVGNWQSELQSLFQLRANIISGSSLANGNPLASRDNDISVISLDTLRGSRGRELLSDPTTIPYDLVIFDEAHKLTCSRDKNGRINRSDRYKLAEMLVGANSLAEQTWRMPWSPKNLILLTATPHMGKDYPYYALWRLLDHRIFSTESALANVSDNIRKRYFLRRIKEEMTRLDGNPLYPKRNSDTLRFKLSEGQDSERELYEATTDYLCYYYNLAKILNPNAAKMTLSVFQRRVASSTYALKRSFERRRDKLIEVIDKVSSGQISLDQIIRWQDQKIKDPFEEQTADEESPTASGLEENEAASANILDQIQASSLVELKIELNQLENLLSLAKRVMDKGVESKFEKLREALSNPQFSQEKILIFTEHRDTLDWLNQRLMAIGQVGKLAFIHGGLDYQERQAAIETFRKPTNEGGAQYLICTDAAAEGVNLQFAWIMINYDIPWNPARLEQRMGRVHRYGQNHDPVILINLVALDTREGDVLSTLLEKLERIKEQLNSEKVYDSVGRVFSNVSIKDYMAKILLAEGTDKRATLLEELNYEITPEQLTAKIEKEAHIYGRGGHVASELPRLRQVLSNEEYLRLLPGYIHAFLDVAAPMIGVKIKGEATGVFKMSLIENSPSEVLKTALAKNPLLCLSRPKNNSQWFHPGESIFTAFVQELHQRLAQEASKGCVFMDPEAQEPYLAHVVKYYIQRDPDQEPLWGLMAARQNVNATITNFYLERFLCLRPEILARVPNDEVATRLALDFPSNYRTKAMEYFITEVERQAQEIAERFRSDLHESEELISRGFNSKASELNQRLTYLRNQKDKSGQTIELAELVSSVKKISSEKKAALVELRRKSENIRPGSIHFITHALILPPISGSIEAEWQDPYVEGLAMKIVLDHETKFGKVKLVHKPELAKKEGLPNYPGFDLISIRNHSPEGFQAERCIEVKGTLGDEVCSLEANELAAAENLRDKYWLYVVAKCASPNPEFLCIPDPVLHFSQMYMKNVTKYRYKISDLRQFSKGD